jgi:hypothetical protein
MSATELKIPFPSERLDALRFFMDKKQQTVERELKDYLNKTYERLVPANVREYVESRLEPEEAQVQTAEPQQAPAPRERQPRPSRRQREQTAAEAPPVQEPQTETEGPAEEETQGMTMSM